MTKVVSFINLKGGVAKTTTLVQVADCLTYQHGKRVLVIDLDPQTNASIALIGEGNWQEADDAQQTIADLFIDKVKGTADFDADQAIICNASNLRTKNLDLLPSSIRLIDIQDRMSDISNTTDHMMNPMEVVKHTLQEKFEEYDYVLIDCPPNLGFITKNGIEVSDYYVIPTIPDRLSTYGIPQIIKNITTFKMNRKLKIECLGVVITKYQSNSTIHANGLLLLPSQLERAFKAAKAQPAPVFSTRMPQANATAEAMDYDRYFSSFKDKYGTTSSGGQPVYKYVESLTQEFLEHAR